MGLGETLSGFFDEEYNRFMGGLERMSRSQWEIQSKMTRRDRENAAKPKLVEVPQWDDVVHVRPRLQVTSEQRNEYWQAQRANRTAALGPEVIQEIERRRGRREAMMRSPQPEFDRAWGSVMTALDNVQDFLAAISVLGRIGLTIGARIGLRTIPITGPILLAADVLTLTMFLGQLAFPAWLALCAGPRDALRAGVGTALTAGVFKGSSALLARGTARSLNWKAHGPIKARAITGVIGAALVLGQTTDQLFGWGLSLGPIVGGTMGAAYGLEAQSRGEAVEVRRSPSAEHFWPRLGDHLEEVPTPALYDRMTAAAVVEQAGLILDVRSPATDAERQLTLAALLPAIGTLDRDWRGTDWQLELPRLTSWRPPAPERAVDLVSWQDFAPPDAPPAPREWPRDAGGEGYDPDAAATGHVPAIVDGIRRVTEQGEPAIERAFYGALTLEGAEALWLLLEDDPDVLRATFTPDRLAVERMAAVGFLPHPGADEPRIQAWWDAALERVENSRRGMMTLREWTELADQHQLDFILVKSPLYI